MNKNGDWNMNTKEKIECLENALAEGTLEVEFDGKKVRYRSLEEIMQILRYLKNKDCLQGSGNSFEKIVMKFEKF